MLDGYFASRYADTVEIRATEALRDLELLAEHIEQCNMCSDATRFYCIRARNEWEVIEVDIEEIAYWADLIERMP